MEPYWGVTRDANASTALINGSNFNLFPCYLRGNHRRTHCTTRPHDIYITFPSRFLRESYDNQWSVERKQHAHDPKRCRSCDLFRGLCPGLQLHRPRM